ncbi:MAG: hypothetical protein KAS07_01985 [Candidatus Pacebacteria bacterium]|nr:hypothetical protein [Candidatus Paceibacterota bacterium]
MKKKIEIYKNRSKKILALLLCYSFPLAVFAVGIIPCGPGGVDAAGNPVSIPCKLEHIPVLINNIMDLIMTIVTPLAIVAFAIGGVMMMFAPAKEEYYKMGRSVIINTFWGMAVTFGSWLIVKAILLALGYQDAFSWVDLI